MKKVCTKCKEEKDISEFNKNKNNKDGHGRCCRVCSNISSREYHSTHKEERKLKDIANAEHIKQVNKIYLQNHKEQSRIYQREYYRKNRETKRIYYNQEDQKKKSRERRQKNKERFNKWFLEYLNENINARIAFHLRGKILKTLKRFNDKKHFKTVELLGCTIPFFKKHIESLWSEGMSWENHTYYGWHLDHIRPVASFDLSDPEQQRQCFHYTNYQPLWHIDNISKGSVYNGKRYKRKIS